MIGSHGRRRGTVGEQVELAFLETWLLAEDRAKKLFTTGVPAPFTVEYRAATSRPFDVEGRAHKILAAHRVNSSREFFSVAVNEAVETIRLSAVEAGGIVSWKAPTHTTCEPETALHSA